MYRQGQEWKFSSDIDSSSHDEQHQKTKVLANRYWSNNLQVNKVSKFRRQAKLCESLKVSLTYIYILTCVLIELISIVLAERMVRLCIASVDPVKLSSQCVMCNRREFPLTVIDCTGITKVNDLISNPLSVQEATCLIYNCRRQVTDVKPEPYHGSVSHAANYRGSASSLSGYPQAASTSPVGPSSSQLHEMMTPSSILSGGYPLNTVQSLSSGLPPHSIYMSRYGPNYGTYSQASGSSASSYLPLGPLTPRGLIGGPNYSTNGSRGPLPYALVQAPSTFPFGVRNKYKMALMPLFR